MGENRRFCGWVEHRMQQLVERIGLDPSERLIAVDDFFLDQRHCNLQRRLSGPLGGAGLQHPQPGRDAG